MYSRYDNFQLSGQSYVSTIRQDGHDWAAYAVFPRAAVHELYTSQTIVNFVLDGEKRMYNGSRVLHVRKGDVLVIPAGTMICSEILHTGVDFRSFNLVIPDELIGEKKKISGDAVPTAMVHLPHRPDWLPYSDGSRTVAAMQEHIWSKLRTNAPLAGMLHKSVKYSLHDLMDQLRTGIHDVRDVNDLAGAAHMSPSTLKRRFRTLFDCSPMEWVWKTRLQRAALQLRAGNLPVSQVAYSSGFADISHFYHVFRKNYGQTPVEWRSQK